MLGFGFLFRKAQATVDNAIAQLVWSLLIAVPMLVAIGFATAAGAFYLHRIYEPEMANLIVAGIYVVPAIAVAMAYAMRTPETAATEEAKAQESAGSEEAEREEADFEGMTSADREMLLAALTTVAPLAMRPVLSTVFRNLPIVLAIGAAAFVLYRASQSSNSGQTMWPAE